MPGRDNPSHLKKRVRDLEAAQADGEPLSCSLARGANGGVALVQIQAGIRYAKLPPIRVVV